MSAIAIILQIIFNLVNSRVDAYRILSDKTIAHGVNFIAYGLFVSAELWYLKLHVSTAIVFCIQAFLNRQNSFDIPLNLRRDLSWDYQSADRPPKAVTDRIEYWIFGYNPAAIAISYIILWAATLIFLFIKFL